MSDPYYKTKHWRDLRAERLRIDMHTCVVPGCNAPAYAVDHVKARRAGGSDTIDNLRSLCKPHDQQAAIADRYSLKLSTEVADGFGAR